MAPDHTAHPHRPGLLPEIPSVHTPKSPRRRYRCFGQITQTAEPESPDGCPHKHYTRTLTTSAQTEQLAYDWDSFTFVGLAEDLVTQCQEAYPLVDVQAEIRKAAVWCRNNEGKAREQNDWPRFLGAWIARAGREASPRAGQSRSPPTCWRSGTTRTRPRLTCSSPPCGRRRECHDTEHRERADRSGRAPQVGWRHHQWRNHPLSFLHRLRRQRYALHNEGRHPPLQVPLLRGWGRYSRTSGSGSPGPAGGLSGPEARPGLLPLGTRRRTSATL